MHSSDLSICCISGLDDDLNVNTQNQHDSEALARREGPWQCHWLCPIVICFIAAHSYSASPVQVLKRQGTNYFEKVYALAYSPDGKGLAVGSSAPALATGNVPGEDRLPEGTIELWDLKVGKLVSTLRQSAKTESGDTANKVGALTFSPDGKWLIGGDAPGYTLWEVATGKQKFKWRSGMIEPLSPAWSPNGSLVALPTMVQPGAPPYETYPQGVAVVEAATGEPKMFFPVEIGYARTARISPDGRLLATAGHDCTVRVFDLAGLTNVFNENLQTTMFAVCFSPDSRCLVAGSSWGGVLIIYEIRSESGRIVVKKKGTSIPGAGEIHSVAFTPDGTRALCISFQGVALWDATTWKSFKTMRECYAGLSPDGNQVALVRESAPTSIEIWATQSLEETMSTNRQ